MKGIKNVVTGSLLVVSVAGYSEPSSYLYSAVPSQLSDTTEPLVMLVMSVDHQLFKKAYSDYSDLDDDGQLDAGYQDTFTYDGYFQSDWCYQYSAAESRFVPAATATGDNSHYCETGTAPWSGNFLNWATMSRIDVLRRVLYGGKRSLDTESVTVLERAYLPRDIHAFVKVYSDSDVSRFTPYSGSVSLCNLSISEDGEPNVRIAQGAWRRWASSEVMQCQWDSDGGPDESDKLAELTVRIESCSSNADGAVSANCRQYTSGKYKPAGLLQKYGEDGSIRFGLISGSYEKNISGGVLRRNITRIGGNETPENDEVDLDSGVFNSSVQGIIHNIDRFRIVNYSYDQNRYTDCDTYGISVQTFKTSRSVGSSKRCSNWGNPLAEMYLEALRYFAGSASPTAAFEATSEHQFVALLSSESWSKPLSQENACADCSIVLISSGINSFDTDELSSSSDLPGLTGSASVDQKTDEVGLAEYLGNFSGYYLSGGSGSERQCTAKYLQDFSEAVGVCPEIPQLEGGYQLSGLAYHGNTGDLDQILDGQQKVKIYTVQLAESMPEFTLQVDGERVHFQPVCHTSSNFGSGTDFSGSGSDCSLTDVVVESMVTDGDGSVTEGSLLFTWEDSLWGNDYDYDASSRIKFCVGAQCTKTADSDLYRSSILPDQLNLAVQVDGVYAGLNMRFGYTVSGTSEDGLQQDYVYKGQNHAQVTTYSASGTTAGWLRSPLWFAAKYGGFTDLDGDGTPGFDTDGDGVSDDAREWDSRNNTSGSAGADGLPDNYFSVANPSQLEVQLGQVFRDISGRISVSTNTALFSNSQQGVGILYQALYQPAMQHNGRSVSWGGMLHALFVDEKGKLREDSNGNARLDSYAEDKLIELLYDANSGQSLFQRYMTTDGTVKTTEGALQPISALQPVWDARDKLSELTDPLTQRNFSSLTGGGRHILTWMDDGDGTVESDELQPFVSDSFSGREELLAVNADEVADTVAYVRGVEISGARNRTIDFDDDGIDEVWRLGDIVHSTPELVAAPSGRYDAVYSDTTYRAFYDLYQDRRHVVYVGSNGGMLHAFNGGFWNSGAWGYDTARTVSDTRHPLGSELWAYVPYNLLPHLQWLREPDYPHVYYMDGEPLAFDVNIFGSEGSDYPDGWGTVLVAGMRLGGGDFSRSVDGQTVTSRSAYVVLDVTNPEEPPKLLAEITHPDLGFTLSRPALVKRRKASGNGYGEADWSGIPEKNEWYLAFASGPAGDGENELRSALEEGSSDQTLKLFLYDLVNRVFVEGFDPLDTGIDAAYGGDMRAVDWDGDYQDDAVYFGSVETGGETLGGRLLRLSLSDDIASSVVNTALQIDRPITSAPLTLSDQQQHWVYFGTGRQQTKNDRETTEPERFVGVIESMSDSGELVDTVHTMNDLVDTTDVQLYSNGLIDKKQSSGNVPLVVDSNEITSWSGLRSLITDSSSGWHFQLTADGSSPAGRSVSPAAAFYSNILFSESIPSNDSCRPGGSSLLVGVHYQTGTASPSAPLGYQDLGEAVEYDAVVLKAPIGQGYSASPVVFHGAHGERTAVVQGMGGSILTYSLGTPSFTSGRMSWRELFDLP